MKQKHKPYLLLPGWVKRAGHTPDSIAGLLKIARNTYDNKVSGKSDFTVTEALALCDALGGKLEDIFLT